MSSLGTELRSLREQQHRSIEDISRQTRISKRYLEYIEADRFDLLPGGAFNRAFVKKYSEAIGMDPQEAVKRYGRSAPTPKSRTYGAEPALYRHRPLLRFLLSSGLTVTLFVLGAILLYREVTSSRAQLEEAKAAVTSSLANLAEIPPSTVPPPEAQPATTSSTLPEAASRVAASTGPQFALNLIIEATNQCWISVNADGRQITSQTLARGDKLPFGANNQFSLILGNAGGVILRLNGQQLRRPGDMGEVKKLLLNLDNYKEMLPEEKSPPQP